jgi:drug/metabolite transporter (DMT)-like permease
MWESETMMLQKAHTTGVNAALFSAFFLGLAPVFGKAAMGPGGFSPLAVVALRTSMAAILLVIILAVVNRSSLYIYPAGLLGCLVAGTVNGIGSIFYYEGLSRLNASVAQMLYALYPFFVAFWLQLDRQSPSKLTVFRIVLAGFAAVLLTKTNGGVVDAGGIVCMLLAALLYALHLPINQRVLFDVPAPTVTVYTLLAMSAIVVPAFLFFDGTWAAGNPPWIPVLALTAVTFLSRLLLFLGVKHIGGMQTALLGLGELLVAIFFSHLILNESLNAQQWLGAAGLGVSLLLVWFEKPPSNPQHPHGLLSWLQPPDFPSDYYKH